MNDCPCGCHSSQLAIPSSIGGGCLSCVSEHDDLPTIGRTIVHTTTYGEELADQPPTTVTLAGGNLSLQLTPAQADNLIRVLSPQGRAVNEIAELAEQYEAGEIDTDDYAERLTRLLAS